MSFTSRSLKNGSSSGGVESIGNQTPTRLVDWWTGVEKKAGRRR
jgi:hypothetical protein